MRQAVVLSILALLSAGVFAVEEPAPAPASSSWEGRRADELVAEWGPPTKTRRNGSLLIYRLRFFGDETVGATALGWGEVGVGPSPDSPESERLGGPPRPAANDLGSLRFGGTREVLATQKVKFHVDSTGVIDKEEFFPLKWKNKP